MKLGICYEVCLLILQITVFSSAFQTSITFGRKCNSLVNTSLNLYDVLFEMESTLNDNTGSLALAFLEDPIGQEVLNNLEQLGEELEEIESDELVEVEMLTGFTRFVNDLYTFFGFGSAEIRLFGVIARLLRISSEYEAGLDEVATEDVMFQSTMLVLATLSFGRSLSPKVKALFIGEVTDLDMRVFTLLFEPKGITMNQFRAMKACGAIEWIEVEPGTIFVDKNDSPGKYLFWLYSGSIELLFEGESILFIERTDGYDINTPGALGLLGDMQFLHVEQKLKVNGKDRVERDAIDYPSSTIKTVGSESSTLLRIDSSKLLQLMGEDDRLSNAIKDILVAGLQRKVVYLLQLRSKELKESREKDKDDANNEEESKTYL
uniref:Cyclic nucleotide-binding domain-containing protein n=1 Tax=Leptocylindrus aporus TaxID=1398097 RepID=A0A7S0KA50_9STRA|mmetsp:Transcript_316/g.392  ORF Transcript_316/g.392 Transcript_316/m.392 type:complete len:377 (+) Transcript_316:94-1224(+)